MRLRQLALAARNLDSARARIAGLLELGRPFGDPQVGVFGLENAVFPVGDTFLELVSPAGKQAPARRFLDGRGTDEAGYMVIFETDDVASDRNRVEALGIRIVWQAETGGASTIHLHPKDTGGAIVSFDHMTEAGTWLWAGTGWQEEVRQEVASLIAGTELSSPDPDATCALWQRMIGEPNCSALNDRSLELGGGGTIRFADSRDTGAVGLTGVDLHIADPDRYAANAEGLGLTTDGRGAVHAGGVWFRPAS